MRYLTRPRINQVCPAVRDHGWLQPSTSNGQLASYCSVPLHSAEAAVAVVPALLHVYQNLLLRSCVLHKYCQSSLYLMTQYRDSMTQYCDSMTLTLLWWIELWGSLPHYRMWHKRQLPKCWCIDQSSENSILLHRRTTAFIHLLRRVTLICK